MPLGERGPRRIRLWEETRPHLGRETTASGTRDDRVWDMKRMNLGRRSPTSRDAGFTTCVFWGQVGESVCSFSRQLVGEKTRDFECRPVFCCIFVVASGQAGEEVPLFSTHLIFI